MTKNPPKLTMGGVPVKPAHVPRPAARLVKKTPEQEAKAIAKSLKAAWASNRATHTAGARQISNMSSRKPYNPLVDQNTVRPGAEQFLSIPSRMGNTLHYRDGRAVHIDDTGSNT